MRNTFINTLFELAEKDSRIVLLTGDLGFMVLEDFQKQFPDRFYNVGVAEQNMIGMATGLAEAGLIPFVYSIAPFVALRPYEFVRNGAGLHQLPVRLIGVGGGFEYSAAGPSHFALEDIAVMRVQPGMQVIAPADPDQATTALLKTWDSPKPIYYRVGKNEKKFVPNLDGNFDLGHLQIVREGEDVLLLAMGAISADVAQVAQQLEAMGIHATVAVIASVQPAPLDDLRALLEQHSVAVSVETHYLTGGLGSLVAEVIADNGLHVKLIRRAVSEAMDGITGSEAFLHQKYGLDVDSLVQVVKNTVEVQV